MEAIGMHSGRAHCHRACTRHKRFQYASKSMQRPLVSGPACNATTKGNEVEIKLRLQDGDAHNTLAAALQPQLQATHQQENIFFDGANQELSQQMVVVRCRFYNVDQRCVLTIKGQQVLRDGIGRGTEVEEDIDPQEARRFIADPDGLLHLPSKILQPIIRQNAVQRMICLGGFRNERKDFSWEGYKLELDKTMFAHGTVFEVEVEAEEPEELKIKLEKFLTDKGIAFKYSTTTKFANFMKKTLD